MFCLDVRYTTQAKHKSTSANISAIYVSVLLEPSPIVVAIIHPGVSAVNFHPSPTNNKYSQYDAFSAPPWPRHQHCINKESSFGTEYNGA